MPQFYHLNYITLGLRCQDIWYLAPFWINIARIGWKHSYRAITMRAGLIHSVFLLAGRCWGDQCTAGHISDPRQCPFAGCRCAVWGYQGCRICRHGMHISGTDHYRWSGAGMVAAGQWAGRICMSNRNPLNGRLSTFRATLGLKLSRNGDI